MFVVEIEQEEEGEDVQGREDFEEEEENKLYVVFMDLFFFCCYNFFFLQEKDEGGDENYVYEYKKEVLYILNCEVVDVVCVVIDGVYMILGYQGQEDQEKDK